MRRSPRHREPQTTWKLGVTAGETDLPEALKILERRAVRDMGLQIVAMTLVYFPPQLALWLPNLVFGAD